MSEDDAEQTPADMRADMRAVVLADPADVNRLRELADQARWTLFEDLPRGCRRMHRLSWRTQDGGEVHYYESHLSGSGVVLAGAPDPSTAEELIDRVSARVPVRTEGDLLARASTASEPAELVSTVLALGVLRTGFFNAGNWRWAGADVRDPRYRELVERLAGHPNRHVRRALMITVADWLSWWPELVEPVLARRAEETELAELVEILAEFAANRTAESSYSTYP